VEIVKLLRSKLVLLASGFIQLNEFKLLIGSNDFAKYPPVNRHHIHSSVYEASMNTRISLNHANKNSHILKEFVTVYFYIAYFG